MLRVQEICKSRGITMQVLASRMGVTYQALYASVSGNPTVNKLQEIADALGVPLAELFEEPQNCVIRCPHCGRPIAIEPKRAE